MAENGTGQFVEGLYLRRRRLPGLGRPVRRCRLHGSLRFDCRPRRSGSLRRHRRHFFSPPEHGCRQDSS